MGVDGSRAMLEKARSAGFPTEFVDIANWAPPEPVDIIFSNAALQWLPAHAALLPRLLAYLTPGGVLAIQMPAMHHAPVRTLQRVVASSGPWATRLSEVTSAPPILEPSAYYDLLSGRAAVVDIWVTEYLHVLRGEDPVVQWAMGTSLRPYLDVLGPDDRIGFLTAYAEALRPHYPPQADGSVLLPFRRLFVLAKN